MKLHKAHPEILVLRPDKGNGVVLLDRSDYVQKMNVILDDKTKFKKVSGSLKKLLIKGEDHVNRTLNELVKAGKLSDDLKNSAHASGSQPGILYGLPKIHKEGCPLRPIISAIGTHSYRLAKMLVPFLSEVTMNEYTLRDSFQFCELIQSLKKSGGYMASFDVASLFTNIPLAETINHICRKVSESTLGALNVDRKDLKKLLDDAVKDNLFLFDETIFSQIDGVAMGSPLGPTFANAFLCHYEQKWLDSCPYAFKPTLYRRYVDDTFLIFRKKSHMQSVSWTF